MTGCLKDVKIYSNHTNFFFLGFGTTPAGVQGGPTPSTVPSQNGLFPQDGIFQIAFSKQRWEEQLTSILEEGKKVKTTKLPWE